MTIQPPQDNEPKLLPTKEDLLKFLDVFGSLSGFEAGERFSRGHGAFPSDTELPFPEVIRVRDWLQSLALDGSPIAAPAQGVPEGWQLVPIEPTDEMLLAASSPLPANACEGAIVVRQQMKEIRTEDYKTMLKAALKPNQLEGV